MITGRAGYGVEIDPDNIVRCIENGINVIQSNLDEGLTDFDDDSFDYVVMTQTIQAVRFPHHLLHEMLRVGREGIVTFPNMGHWACRVQLAFGRMPVTRHLPNTWYNTPNIHICTISDFEDFCRDGRLRDPRNARPSTPSIGRGSARAFSRSCSGKSRRTGFGAARDGARRRVSGMLLQRIKLS